MRAREADRTGAGAIQSRGDGTFLVSGELTFDSVVGVRSAGVRVLGEGSLATFDLQGVSRTDSAGLALLVDWLREARRRGVRLRYSNIPRQMLAMAATSNLEHLLDRRGPA